jgi:hypothetical protein
LFDNRYNIIILRNGGKTVEKEKSIGLILTELEIRSILSRRQSQLRRLRPVAVAAGDVIWGKEVYRLSLHSDGYDETGAELVHDCPAYRATGTYRCGKELVYTLEDVHFGFWSPAYLMPPSLSRLRLRVERCWSERLARVIVDPTPAGAETWQLFAANWDIQYRDKRVQWESNPMVTVVQFHLEKI